MRDVICQKFCSYYQPQKDEAEKCLAYELLAAWSGWEPKLGAVLASTPHPDLLPSRGEGKIEVGACGHQDSFPALETGLRVVTATICPRCAFRSHGCDFVARSDEAAAPCGGLRALAVLLGEGVISGEDLAGVWERFLMTGYLRLAEHVSLRYLEAPHLYDRQADELYEVNEAGFDWLARCDGTTPGLAALADRDFWIFC